MLHRIGKISAVKILVFLSMLRIVLRRWELPLSHPAVSMIKNLNIASWRIGKHHPLWLNGKQA
jgi:hypothetical protein